MIATYSGVCLDDEVGDHRYAQSVQHCESSSVFQHFDMRVSMMPNAMGYDSVRRLSTQYCDVVQTRRGDASQQGDLRYIPLILL